MQRFLQSAFASLLFLVVSLLCGCSSQSSTTIPSDSDTPTTTDASNEAQRVVDEQTDAKPIELEPLPEPSGEGGSFEIAQIMQLAHENKLYRELYQVPVDEAVGERILTLYKDLPGQSPPKGDVEAWQTRAQSLLDAATAVINGDETQVAAFKKAINCNSCHSRHRS